MYAIIGISIVCVTYLLARLMDHILAYKQFEMSIKNKNITRVNINGVEYNEKVQNNI